MTDCGAACLREMTAAASSTNSSCSFTRRECTSEPRLRPPFGWLSAAQRRRALWALGSATLAIGVPLLALEREMKRAGGPGIIPFELAGTPQRAERIMRRWGKAGQAAARRSLILDYPFLATYSALQAFGCNAASDAMRTRDMLTLAAAGPPLAWAQLAAGGFDAAENAALLAVLAGCGGRLPALARACANAKFVLLGAGWTYLLCAAANSIHARRPRKALAG